MFLTSILLTLALQLAPVQSSSSAQSEHSERTYLTSTIVIRPTVAVQHEQHIQRAARPYQIIGHATIADFVDSSLGFSPRALRNNRIDR